MREMAALSKLSNIEMKKKTDFGLVYLKMCIDSNYGYGELV